MSDLMAAMTWIDPVDELPEHWSNWQEASKTNQRSASMQALLKERATLQARLEAQEYEAAALRDRLSQSDGDLSRSV